MIMKRKILFIALLLASLVTHAQLPVTLPQIFTDVTVLKNLKLPDTSSTKVGSIGYVNGITYLRGTVKWDTLTGNFNGVKNQNTLAQVASFWINGTSRIDGGLGINAVLGTGERLHVGGVTTVDGNVNVYHGDLIVTTVTPNAEQGISGGVRISDGENHGLFIGLADLGQGLLSTKIESTNSNVPFGLYNNGVPIAYFEGATSNYDIRFPHHARIPGIPSRLENDPNARPLGITLSGRIGWFDPGYFTLDSLLRHVAKLSFETESPLRFVEGDSALGHLDTLIILPASASQGGYLSASDWTTFNNKLSSVDTSNISNFYLKVRSLFSASGDLTYNPSTGQFSVTAGTTYTDEQAQDAIGVMVSNEFTYTDATPLLAINEIAQSKITGLTSALAGKQAALSGTGFVKISGITISYDNSTYLTAVDTSNISNFYLKVRSLLSAGTGITYNSSTGAIANAGVLSVNGNTGALTMDTGYIANFYAKVRSLFTAGTGISISNGVITATGGGGGASALDDLTDVVITSAADKDVLMNDGTEWVNTPGTEIDETGASAGYPVVYSAAGSYGIASPATFRSTLGLTDADKGDITTSSNFGTFTIDNNVVTLAKMATMATASFLGRNSASTGNVEVLSASTARSILGLTDADKGDITTSSNFGTFTIDNGVVTLAKMANMATASILGRNTAGTGAPEVLSASTVRSILGLTDADKGDITTSSSFGTFTIDNGVVSLAKMANLAANSFIGNNTGSSATPVALSVAQAKALLALSVSDISGAAPLASPTFTGTPAAPTAATGTSTTQLATTAFVQQEKLSTAGQTQIILDTDGTISAGVTNVIYRTTTSASGTTTITLPAASSNTGRVITISNRSAEDISLASAGGDLWFIKGHAGLTGSHVTGLQGSTNCGYIAFFSDGTDWFCLHGLNVITGI